MDEGTGTRLSLNDMGLLGLLVRRPRPTSAPVVVVSAPAVTPAVPARAPTSPADAAVLEPWIRTAFGTGLMQELSARGKNSPHLPGILEEMGLPVGKRAAHA